MKLKIGDNVRIKKGNSNTGGVSFVPSMEKYEGTEDVIKRVNGKTFLLEGNTWTWSSEWLEKIEETILVKDIVEGVEYNMTDNYGGKRRVKLEGRTIINLDGGKNSTVSNAYRLGYKFEEIKKKTLPKKWIVEVKDTSSQDVIDFWEEYKKNDFKLGLCGACFGKNEFTGENIYYSESSVIPKDISILSPREYLDIVKGEKIEGKEVPLTLEEFKDLPNKARLIIKDGGEDIEAMKVIDSGGSYLCSNNTITNGRNGKKEGYEYSRINSNKYVFNKFIGKLYKAPPTKELIFEDGRVNLTDQLRHGDVLEVNGEKAKVVDDNGNRYIVNNKHLEVTNYSGKKEGYKYNYIISSRGTTDFGSYSKGLTIYRVGSEDLLTPTPGVENNEEKIKDLESRLDRARTEFTRQEDIIRKQKEEIEKIKIELPKKAIEKYKKEQKRELLKRKKKTTAKKKTSLWDEVIIDDINYRKLELSYDTKMPLLLKGPAGVGKSTFIRTLANEKKSELVQFNFNGDTTVEHLLGHKILVGGDMLWEDGPLTDAVRNGKIFLADEINASSAEIQFILNGLLELKEGNLGKLSVQGNNGEVIEAHPNFRFYGTYNPGYLGTKNFGNSIMSRFIGIDIKPLDVVKEKELLLTKYPELEEEIDLLVKLEDSLRKNKDFSYDVSTRDLLQTLMFIDGGFSIEEAIEATIENSLQIDLDVDILKDTLQNIS